MAIPKSLHNGKAWQYFEQVHASLVLAERQLAEHYISCEVYVRLRNAAAGTPADDERLLISSLQSVELDLLQGKPLPYKQLVSLVDYIRQRPEIFPEWQTSSTAELYRPHAFQNKKSSSGYWF